MAGFGEKRWMAMLLTVIFLALFLAGDEKVEVKTLPVVSIVAESLTDWQGKKDVREAELTYEDVSTDTYFSMPVTIHIQGASSAKYPKKNFTIKLDKKMDVRKGWGAHKKYCLKANYTDPTHAGNIVSARLAGQMQRQYGLFERAPNAGAVDGFPVWLILNGEPAGLYTWNIPKDEWMLGLDKNNEDHIALFAENWKDDVFFRGDEINFRKDWTFVTGKSRKNREKFERVYRFVRDATDEEFRANADQYLDLDACFNYYCFICISHARDNKAKNMILVTEDGLRWAPTLYDLDSLWGINWNGTGLASNDIQTGANKVINSQGLLERIRVCFPDEIRARYAELRRYPLSKENIRAEFERLRAEIPERYYAMDRELWYPDDNYIRTYEIMYDFLDEYLPVLDAAFGYEEAPAPQT